MAVANVVVCVKGGMVQCAYSDTRNVCIDLEVIDLDASSYPEDGEIEETDLNEQRIEEIENDPSWHLIY